MQLPRPDLREKIIKSMTDSETRVLTRQARKIPKPLIGRITSETIGYSHPITHRQCSTPITTCSTTTTRDDIPIYVLTTTTTSNTQVNKHYTSQYKDINSRESSITGAYVTKPTLTWSRPSIFDHLPATEWTYTHNPYT